MHLYKILSEAFLLFLWKYTKLASIDKRGISLMVKLDATDITIVVRFYNASSIVIHIVVIQIYVLKTKL